MRTITLEEHFVTESFLKATGGNEEDSLPMRLMRPMLLDLGGGRIAAMDEGGVDLQVMSLASIGLDRLAASDETSVLHDVNDELAEAVHANTKRLAGWTALALRSPDKAAAEFERCVTKLGFKGALVDGTIDGKFLDAPEFTPLWETAVSLGVPIYLHPAPPPEVVKKIYFGGLPGEVGQVLSIAGWGWHAETALHTLRLIVAGIFDRFPQLQLVIGHMGEMLPMALARTASILDRTAQLKQPVEKYFQTNIHVTTSGYFTQPPFQCALEVVGVDRMLYSVDYPFSQNTQGAAFLREAAHRLTDADLHKLTHRNAEHLLNLPPV